MNNLLSSIKRAYRRFNVTLYKGKHNHYASLDEGNEYVCLNCGAHFKGRYCPHCRQPGDTKRVTLGNIASSIKDNFTSMDYAIFHTILQLLYRPGYMARDYLHGHRKEYTNPFALVFSLVMVDGLLNYLWHDTITDSDDGSTFFGLGYTYQNMILIIFGIIASLPLWGMAKLTKLGKSTNLAETCYFFTYVACIWYFLQIILVRALPRIIQNVSEDRVYAHCGLIWFIYIYVAVKQFYKLRLVGSILLYILFILVIFVITEVGNHI